MTPGDALALVRDVGALSLLALLAVRVGPALVVRLDYLAACLSRVAGAWSIDLPPPPPPLPSLLPFHGGFPMRRWLLLLLLVPVLTLCACAASDAASATTKRALCAFGDGVATSTRIWCGEPTGVPMGHAEAPAARVRVEVVQVPLEGVPRSAAAYTFSRPEGSSVPASAVCDGPGCDVPDPTAYRRGPAWCDAWGDPPGWVTVRRLEPAAR